MIESLIQISMENLNESERELLQSVKSRIRSITLVHDKLYQSPNFITIDAREYLLELLQNIEYSAASDRDIKIKTDIPPLEMDADTIVPLGIIVNEVVINSFKHAFEKTPGIIQVALLYDSRRYIHLTVEDNGVGIHETGSDKNHEGVGRQLIQALTIQLEGTCSWEGADGVRFTLSFPYELKHARTGEYEKPG